MKIIMIILAFGSISSAQTYTRVGSTVYSSTGNRYTTVGANTYGSDGTISTTVGNTTYVHNYHYNENQMPVYRPTTNTNFDNDLESFHSPQNDD